MRTKFDTLALDGLLKAVVELEGYCKKRAIYYTHV